MSDRDPRKIALGARLAAARNGLGFSQARVATMIGVTPGAVGQYEAGIAAPSLPRMEQLALALDTTVEWLLTGDQPEEVAKAQTQNEMEALRILRGLSSEQQATILAMLRAVPLRRSQ